MCIVQFHGHPLDLLFNFYTIRFKKKSTKTLIYILRYKKKTQNKILTIIYRIKRNERLCCCDAIPCNERQISSKRQSLKCKK